MNQKLIDVLAEQRNRALDELAVAVAGVRERDEMIERLNADITALRGQIERGQGE